MSFPPVPNNQNALPNQPNGQTFVPGAGGQAPNLPNEFSEQAAAPQAPTSPMDQVFATSQPPAQPTRPEDLGQVMPGQNNAAQIRPLAQVYAPSAAVASAVDATRKSKQKKSTLLPLFISLPFILVILFAGIYFTTLWGMSFYGTRQYKAQHYQSAYSNFSWQQTLANSWPEGWRPRYNAGTSLLAAKDLQGGVDKLEDALRLVPKATRNQNNMIIDPYAPECRVRLNLGAGYYAQGNQALDKGEPAQAEELFRKVKTTLEPCSSGKPPASDEQDKKDSQSSDPRKQADHKKKQADDKQRQAEEQQGKQPEPEQNNPDNQQQQQQNQGDQQQKQDKEQMDPQERKRREELEKRNEKSRQQQQNEQDKNNDDGGSSTGRNW